MGTPAGPADGCLKPVSPHEQRADGLLMPAVQSPFVLGPLYDRLFYGKVSVNESATLYSGKKKATLLNVALISFRN